MSNGKEFTRAHWWTRPGDNKNRIKEITQTGAYVLDERLDAWYGHAVATLIEGEGKASLVLLDDVGDPTTDILELEPGKKAYFKKAPAQGEASGKAVIDAFGDIQLHVLELPENGRLLVEFLI